MMIVQEIYDYLWEVVYKLKCPYCKKAIEDKGKFCPHCGKNLEKEAQKRKIVLGILIGAIFIIIAVGIEIGVCKNDFLKTDSLTQNGIIDEETNTADDVENARVSLFRKILDSYQNEKWTPTYADIELTGDETEEIIVRTYTSEATEGGRYIYNIYQYDSSSKVFISPTEEISSFAYEALLYDSDSKKLIVDWTYADEKYFVIYSYDNFKLSIVDEVEEDMSHLPVLHFSSIIQTNNTEEKKIITPQAKITISGKEYKIVDLLVNQTFMVETDSGYNKITVKDGYIFVEEADCPQQICVNQGKKNTPGSMIVCLPHKLLIEITKD